MIQINFNDNWDYGHLGQNDRTSISLPHDAMLSEKRTTQSKGGLNIAWFEGHDYWYEREFEATEELLSGHVILEFEGVYHRAEVYLNGEKVAHWPYGYRSNFYIDITGKIITGNNILRVIARNADQPNSRWYSGSGIYRPVNLYILPKEHILLNGIKIKTLDYNSREIEVSVQTNASGQAVVEILDDETSMISQSLAVAKEGSIVLRIPDAELWSPEAPVLYTCKVTFMGDEQTVRFGIRSIAFDAINGFQINGKRIVLRGACIHHDNGILGACAFEFAEKRKVRLLQKVGYNAIRSAHNPCSKALLNACDELGMLVMDELVDCWYIHKTKYDYVNDFDQWWDKDLQNMVDKDYNHPSVIMYSTGNEVSETAEKKGIELTRIMTEYLHGLDDSRPVTCGVNIFFNYLSSLGFGVYSDQKAEKEAKSAGKAKQKKQAVGSEFFNQLAGKLGDKTMKLGATLHGCDVKTRDAFGNMDIAGYNYGIFRYKKDVKKYPNRLILGTETFCKDAHAFMGLAEKYPSIIGDFVWAGMDYLGEAGIGSHEYKDYAKDFTSGVGWISAGSGRLDLTGNELAEALYTKVAFGVDPIDIAVVPVNNYGKPHSPSAWKMTNARSSWAWNGCDGKETVVEVYANAHTIQLFLNDRKIGEKKCGKSLRTYFKVKYYPGSIKAIAFDANGKVVAETALHTAGEDTVLSVYPESSQIGPNDLAYIRLKYTDGAGVLKPLARGKIKIEVSGGALLGFGHACPFNEDGYLSNISDTYFGEALAVVKPKKAMLTIAASSPYGGNSIQITVKK